MCVTFLVTGRGPLRRGCHSTEPTHRTPFECIPTVPDKVARGAPAGGRPDGGHHRGRCHMLASWNCGDYRQQRFSRHWFHGARGGAAVVLDVRGEEHTDDWPMMPRAPDVGPTVTVVGGGMDSCAGLAGKSARNGNLTRVELSLSRVVRQIFCWS